MTSPASPPLALDRTMARAIRRTSLLMSLGALVLLGSLVYGAYRLQRTASALRANEARLQEQRQQITQQDSIIAANEARIRTLLPSALRGFGWSADSIPIALRSESTRVEQSLRANQALQRLEQERGAGAAGGIRVRYFAKDTLLDVNQRIVIENLRRLGYDVAIERPPIGDVPTNAIWFGSEVDIDDVKAIALTMIRAGYGIKAIRPFAQPGGIRARQVQIGADRTLVGRPDLTVEGVDQTKEFTRNPEDMRDGPSF